MSDRKVQPFECWRLSGGDPAKYRQLLIDNGHLVQREPPAADELCATCTKPFIAHADFVVQNPYLTDEYKEQLEQANISDHEFKRLPEPHCGQLILGRNTQRRREQGRQRDDA